MRVGGKEKEPQQRAWMEIEKKREIKVKDLGKIADC